MVYFNNLLKVLRGSTVSLLFLIMNCAPFGNPVPVHVYLFASMFYIIILGNYTYTKTIK